MPRLCIIGGGPSGLAQIKAFKSLKDAAAAEWEIVCLEKQSNFGGLWNFSMDTGLDEFGDAVHGSMYRYLWSNGPKEGLEFADYSFEEHFGRPIPSYPPRPVLCDYIQGRIKKNGLSSYIKCNSNVRDVTFNEETSMFTVTYMDTVNKIEHKEVFDNVVVATGHFSTPNNPEDLLEKLKGFKGSIIHATDFREATLYTGKDVLVIGSSYSAEDIGSQCYKYGSKSVTVCWRSKPLGYKWPETWNEVPLITHCEGNTCYFKDGSSHHIDAIILCTGYKHYFPFFKADSELALPNENRLWPLGLYKGVAWTKNPKLFYLGMQDQYYTFNMFDAQAWVVRDMLLGKIKIPSLSEMEADNLRWRKMEEDMSSTAEDQIIFQGNYVKDLCSLTDYNFSSTKIDAVNQCFIEWKHHKNEDIMGYRNYAFKSIMTGTMAPVHHTPWLQALDDTMECFLNKDRKYSASH